MVSTADIRCSSVLSALHDHVPESILSVWCTESKEFYVCDYDKIGGGARVTLSLLPEQTRGVSRDIVLTENTRILVKHKH